MVIHNPVKILDHKLVEILGVLESFDELSFSILQPLDLGLELFPSLLLLLNLRIIALPGFGLHSLLDLKFLDFNLFFVGADVVNLLDVLQLLFFLFDLVPILKFLTKLAIEIP